jgi:hypothetical protein
MRRLLALPAFFLAALLFAAGGIADPGKGKSSKSKGKGNRMSFTVATTDNGSCGTPWANDTLQRTFQVKDNGDGTYRLTRKDRGTFVTLGGASPGACDTSGKHGTVVRAGVTGKVVGFLRGTITGGTFNPNATCTGATCGFTDVFIATFFGAGAQFSCFSNSRDCRFNYNYTAPRQPLRYRHWQNKGKGAGTFLEEQFIGDIADR